METPEDVKLNWKKWGKEDAEILLLPTKIKQNYSWDPVILLSMILDCIFQTSRQSATLAATSVLWYNSMYNAVIGVPDHILSWKPPTPHSGGMHDSKKHWAEALNHNRRRIQEENTLLSGFSIRQTVMKRLNLFGTLNRGKSKTWRTFLIPHSTQIFGYFNLTDKSCPFNKAKEKQAIVLTVHDS